MADLLNFNPYRGLEFDSSRPLEFDSGRPLQFDSARNLEFQPNRDLGFGRRGVVFRGYVCPICGSLVSEDAERCTECGAVFESTPRAARPPASAPATSAPAPAKISRPIPPPARVAASDSSIIYCAFCGVKLKRSDSFCWNCGTRTNGSSEAVKLPAKKSPPVARDWRGNR
ncbi:MAG TPA: hypothetical protein VJN63_05170 [Thermoplasmata archaeon]|nr:hypothetical protein [Thermoplasmata archaeon]